MPPDLKLAKLTRLKSGLETVQAELSLHLLIALITIAARPGLSVNDLADELKVPQQTASRYVAMLLARYQNVSTSLQVPLIAQQISEEDPRKRALTLTDQGRDRLEHLLEAMNE